MEETQYTKNLANVKFIRIFRYIKKLKKTNYEQV